MIKSFLLIFVFILSSLHAEDLVNYSYQQSRIKTKAKHVYKSRKTRRICYIYVNINGNREWRRYKDRLNTTIRNNQNSCKKYVIYKIVQNVHTNFYRTNASNTSNKDYKINLGAIVKENADIDIQIFTIVKNSKIRNGFSEQNVNTGIVNTSNNIDNTKYDVHSNVQNSKIGQQDYLSEKGLNIAVDFLKRDKDDPLN